MLNSISILKEARDLGSTATLSQVEAEIATHDYPILRNAEKLNYTVSLYDKISPINGIPAETVMADVVENGEIYLIHVNGNLVYLQKHDPSQVGFVAMNSSTAIAKANEQVDGLVEAKVDEKVKVLVLRALL